MRIDHTEQPDISPQGWLLASLKAISTGNASFSPTAASLGEIHIQSLSRQAPHQRMNPRVIDFLQTALRHVAQARKRSLPREDWDSTNICANPCGVDDLVCLYRQHGEIEIHFRAWKQSLEMKRELHRITSRAHLHPALLTAMIFSALAIKIRKSFPRWKARMEIRPFAKWNFRKAEPAGAECKA
jgi:hypothetical protein